LLSHCFNPPKLGEQRGKAILIDPEDLEIELVRFTSEQPIAHEAADNERTSAFSVCSASDFDSFFDQ
jgi:hypothetical protein